MNLRERAYRDEFLEERLLAGFPDEALVDSGTEETLKILTLLKRRQNTRQWIYHKFYVWPE